MSDEEFLGQSFADFVKQDVLILGEAMAERAFPDVQGIRDGGGVGFSCAPKSGRIPKTAS